MKHTWIALFLLAAPVMAEDFIVKNGMQESAKPGELIPVNQNDVRILRRAAEILKKISSWNRKDDRECPPTRVTYSLYCAMWKATEEVNGEFNHRVGALEELRRTVEEMSKGKEYEHRLMGFNNDPGTTLAKVQNALKTTRMRIAARLKKRAPR